MLNRIPNNDFDNDIDDQFEDKFEGPPSNIDLIYRFGRIFITVLVGALAFIIAVRLFQNEDKRRSAKNKRKSFEFAKNRMIEKRLSSDLPEELCKIDNSSDSRKITKSMSADSSLNINDHYAKPSDIQKIEPKKEEGINNNNINNNNSYNNFVGDSNHSPDQQSGRMFQKRKALKEEEAARRKSLDKDELARLKGLLERFHGSSGKDVSETEESITKEEIIGTDGSITKKTVLSITTKYHKKAPKASKAEEEKRTASKKLPAKFGKEGKEEEEEVKKSSEKEPVVKPVAPAITYTWNIKQTGERLTYTTGLPAILPVVKAVYKMEGEKATNQFGYFGLEPDDLGPYDVAHKPFLDHSYMVTNGRVGKQGVMMALENERALVFKCDLFKHVEAKPVEPLADALKVKDPAEELTEREEIKIVAASKKASSADEGLSSKYSLLRSSISSSGAEERSSSEKEDVAEITRPRRSSKEKLGLFYFNPSSKIKIKSSGGLGDQRIWAFETAAEENPDAKLHYFCKLASHKDS